MLAAVRDVMMIHVCIIITITSAWLENLQPKKILDKGVPVTMFQGNASHTDHFKLLEQDGNFLLIGARNVVYNLSLHDLSENQRLEWPSRSDHRNLCLLKGKSEDDCHNFIRVLVKREDGLILVCGTNSFKPLCRNYEVMADGNFRQVEEQSGVGLCPYDPHHNSTALYTDGSLYTATVADFGGTDPVIYKKPLRTEQFDLKQLNAPDFVSTMEYDGQVLFFFRESAVEYINCGKTIYSRVARVCQGDRGGPHKFQDRWTSYLKSRLNCSVPGAFPFYFNEIQSTSDIISYPDADDVVYGVFTTPSNSLPGSAICAFKIKDIFDTYEGPFKEQATVNSNWLPVRKRKEPDPRPGSCGNDSRTLPDHSLNFLKAHSLMDEAVPAYLGAPILVRASMKYQLTKIAVDPQIQSTFKRAYDILFVGTDTGRLLKVVNTKGPAEEVAPVIVEEIQVLPARKPITNLVMIRTDRHQPKVIVVSDDQVIAVPVQRCNTNAKTCRQCVALQDPYCAWNPNTETCEAAGSPKYSLQSYHIQDIERGKSPYCPKDIPQTTTQSTTTTVNTPMECNCETKLKELSSKLKQGQDEIAKLQASSLNQDPGDVIQTTNDVTTEPAPARHVKWEQPKVYTAETLSLILTTACLGALVLGFIAGFLCARHCKEEECGYEGKCFLEQKNHVAITPYEVKLMNHTEPSTINNAPDKKPINVLLNMPEKNIDKNLTQNLSNPGVDTGTLQKVKKTYL